MVEDPDSGSWIMVDFSLTTPELDIWDKSPTLIDMKN